MTTAPTINQSRYANLDALKGLAVAFMVFQHLTFWLWKSPRLPIDEMFITHPLIMSLNTTGGISAALFVLVSGLGYGFFLSKSGNAFQSIKRGFFIIACGYSMNILVPSWFTIGSWYVLHCIGFMIILSPLLKRMNKTALLFTAILIILIAPLGQILLSTPATISNNRMGMYKIPGGFFRLMFFEGHFPIFPWAAFFVTGILCHRILAECTRIKILFLGIGSVAIGIIFSAAGFSPAIMQNGLLHRMFYLKTNFYPANPPLMFFLIGIAVLLSFTALSLPGLSQKNPLVTLGRISLTVFVTHAVFFREGSLRFQYFQSYSEMQAVAIMISAVAAFMTISFFWNKIRFTGSLEWIMRKIAQ